MIFSDSKYYIMTLSGFRNFTLNGQLLERGRVNLENISSGQSQILTRNSSKSFLVSYLFFSKAIRSLGLSLMEGPCVACK